MRGHRENLAGLLRMMADEIMADDRSVTCFAEDPDWDPSMKLELRHDEDRRGPGSTTITVQPF